MPEKKISGRHWLWAGAIVLAMAIALFALGRLPICDCGYVNFWYGNPFGAQNSQHLFDPYSFTHLLHGFGFYFLLWLVLPRRVPLGWRFLIAVALESGWEALENTSFIIDRYRETTASLGYYGDSIVNSISDVAVMAAAFLWAAHFPVWTNVVLFITIELFLLWWIRDNLTLNILMLIYPFETLKLWQGG